MTISEIIALAVLAAAGVLVMAYLVVAQKKKCAEWLKWAVVEAEKYLGSGTGQLKLRQVYDWFCESFPIIAAVLPFPIFSKWVDVALETMNDWLNNNAKIVEYVRTEGSE